jgi:transcriptional/translational regulatory protein YebC/TACO1
MDDTGCVSQMFDQKGVLTVLNEEGALEEDDEEEMNRRNG